MQANNEFYSQNIADDMLMVYFRHVAKSQYLKTFLILARRNQHKDLEY